MNNIEPFAYVNPLECSQAHKYQDARPARSNQELQSWRPATSRHKKRKHSNKGLLIGIQTSSRQNQWSSAGVRAPFCRKEGSMTAWVRSMVVVGDRSTSFTSSVVLLLYCIRRLFGVAGGKIGAIQVRM
jgi:hypothetical protein